MRNLQTFPILYSSFLNLAQQREAPVTFAAAKQ